MPLFGGFVIRVQCIIFYEKTYAEPHFGQSYDEVLMYKFKDLLPLDHLAHTNHRMSPSNICFLNQSVSATRDHITHRVMPTYETQFKSKCIYFTWITLIRVDAAVNKFVKITCNLYVGAFKTRVTCSFISICEVVCICFRVKKYDIAIVIKNTVLII